MKRFMIMILMFVYLYGLAYNQFITPFVRIPIPLLSVLPLIFLFGNFKKVKFLYKKELLLFFISSSMIHLLGYENIKVFSVLLINVICCLLYFNYFIDKSIKRLTITVVIFIGLLLLSTLVMLLNHLYPGPVDLYRRLITGEVKVQSPSGITPYIFSFGYQLSALVSFLIVACTVFKRTLLIHFGVFLACVFFILYGMNRSVFVGFIFSAGLFWLFYYKSKVIIIACILVGFSFLFNSAIQSLSDGRQQNVLSKNERKSSENRQDLMLENLKIIADNPFGLIFYGKSWSDVASRNPEFKQGDAGLVTSHNAYLMFITYVGIIPGLVILFLIYRKILLIFWSAVRRVQKKENALLICLCFSFIAISINAMFHNEWLLGGSGPSLFLYFSILQLSEILKSREVQSFNHQRDYQPSFMA